MSRKDITLRTKEYFERAMLGHTAIWDITNTHDDVYQLSRTNARPTLNVLIVDIYICGEADICDIMYNYHDLDCIVLVGFYNRYSKNAKELALTNNIGLYDMREFFGAVNLVGKKMLNYIKKER